MCRPRRLALAMMLLPSLAFAQGASQVPPDPGPGSGRPANLCQELVAFIRQPDAARKADEAPARLATAVSAKKQDDSSAKPSADGTPQNTSGQSGQITASGPGASGPQGVSQNETAPSGSTATAVGPSKDTSQSASGRQGQQAAKPAPTAETSAPKPTAENVHQIEAAAAANDLQGCRAVGQRMRRAGVAMPPSLIALSALAPKLLEAAQQP